MVGLGTGAPIVQVYHEKSFVLPDVARVLACLYEKDVKFETHTASYKSLLRLQASSHAPVPFYDGPTFLEESREICRYIAEKYEHQGYPFLLGKDALERASVEQWLHNEEHAFNPPSRALFCHLAFPLGEEEDDNIDIHTRKLEEVLEVYEQRLSDSEFLVGSKFTLADLVHLPNSHYIKASNKFLYLYDSRKNVRRWWDAISDRDSWKKVLRYMKRVEEQNNEEELKKQQQQEEDRRTSADSIRLDSREQIRTEPRTILVPPTVSSSSIVHRTKKPLSSYTSTDEILISSSHSTPAADKTSAVQSKETTIFTNPQETPPISVQSTPGTSKKHPIPVQSTKHATSPTTAKKPPITDATKSSSKDASILEPSSPKNVSSNLDGFDHYPSHTDVYTPYIEPTTRKTSETFDQQYPSQDLEQAASHSVPQEPMSMELVQGREKKALRPTGQSKDVSSQLEDYASSDQRGDLLPPSTQEHGLIPSRQVAAKDAQRRILSQAAHPGSQDTSKQPRDHGSVPRQGEPQDAREILDESQAVDSSTSSERISYTSQSSLPSHATTPFETRYPVAEDTSKQAKDKMSTTWQMTNPDAGDITEDTKVSESSSFQVQPSYFERADAPSRKQETIDDTFKETESGDLSFHSGTWQGGHSVAPPSQTRYQTPSKTRYPIAEAASKQARGTAPTPQKKAAQDDNDTSDESTTADEVASFQKRYPYDEEDIQVANTASVSWKTPDGDKNIFEETKIPDSTPTTAKLMYTQRAPSPPPRQAEVKDAKDKGRQSRVTIPESQKMVPRDAQTTHGERKTGTPGEQSSDRLQAIPQSRLPAAEGLSTNEHTVVPPLLTNAPISRVQPASESLQEGLPTKPSNIEQWQRASVPLNDITSSSGDGEVGMATIDRKLAPMSQQVTPSSEDVNQMAKESGKQRVEPSVHTGAETPGVQSTSSSFPGASTAHHATSDDKFARQSIIDERVREPTKKPYSAPAHTKRETPDGHEIVDSELISTHDRHVSEAAEIRQDQATVHEDVHDANLSDDDVAKDTFKETKVGESTPSSAKPMYPQQSAPTPRHAELEDTWDRGTKGRETAPDRQQMLEKWAGTAREQVSDRWKASPPSRQAAAEDVRGATGEYPDGLDASKKSRGTYEEAEGPGSIKEEKRSSIYQKKPLEVQDSQKQAQTIPAGEKAYGSIRKHQQASDAPNTFDEKLDTSADNMDSHEEAQAIPADDKVDGSTPEHHESSGTPYTYNEKLSASAPARADIHDGHSAEEQYKKYTVDDQKVASSLSSKEPASHVQPASEPLQRAVRDGDFPSKSFTIDQWQRTAVPLHGVITDSGDDDAAKSSNNDQKTRPMSQEATPSSQSINQMAKQSGEQRVEPPVPIVAEISDVGRAALSLPEAARTDAATVGDKFTEQSNIDERVGEPKQMQAPITVAHPDSAHTLRRTTDSHEAGELVSTPEGQRLEGETATRDPATIHEDVYDASLSTHDVASDEKTATDHASGDEVVTGSLHDQQAPRPASTQAQPTVETPHDSDSFQYGHTGDSGKTELTKPTVTDQEATLPAAGPTSVGPQHANIVPAGVAHSEQKSTPSDKGPTRATQHPSPVEPIKADNTVSAAGYTYAPQMIFRQEARPPAPSTIGIRASDTQGVIGKIQEVTPDNRGSDDSEKPFVPSQEHVSHASEAIPGQEEMTSPQGASVFPMSDNQLSSADVHEVTPDDQQTVESITPLVSSGKQGSHVRSPFKPGEVDPSEKKFTPSDEESPHSSEESISAEPRKEQTVIPTTEQTTAQRTIIGRQDIPDRKQALTSEDTLNNTPTQGDVHSTGTIEPARRPLSVEGEELMSATQASSPSVARDSFHTELENVQLVKPSATPDARDITPSSAPGEAALAEQKSASSGQGSADPAQPAFSLGPRNEKIRDSSPAMLISSTDPSKGDPMVAVRDQTKDSQTTPGQQDILSTEHSSGKVQENIPGDNLGKAKPSRPLSAIQDGDPSKASALGIQLGSVPNELSVDEQNFAPPGQDSAYVAWPPSSAEPRSKEMEDLAPSTQLNSTTYPRSKDAIVAAPDQTTDSQTTAGRQVKFSAPSSQGPLGKLQEHEPADDSDETKSSKPPSVVREGKPAAAVPISAPDTQHGTALDQVAVEQKFSPSGQDSVHSVQTSFSTEPTKEDTVVARTDETSTLERTVNQNYMTPAADKAKAPFSGTPDASSKTQRSIEDDQIDEKLPSQGQFSPDRHVSESPQGRSPEAHGDVVDKETTLGSSKAETSKTGPGSTSISADGSLTSSDVPAAGSLPETQDLQDYASAKNVLTDSLGKIKSPGHLSTDQDMAPIMSPSLPSVSPLGAVPGANSVQPPQQASTSTVDLESVPDTQNGIPQGKTTPGEQKSAISDQELAHTIERPSSTEPRKEEANTAGGDQPNVTQGPETNVRHQAKAPPPDPRDALQKYQQPSHGVLPSDIRDRPTPAVRSAVVDKEKTQPSVNEPNSTPTREDVLSTRSVQNQEAQPTPATTSQGLQDSAFSQNDSSRNIESPRKASTDQIVAPAINSAAPIGAPQGTEPDEAIPDDKSPNSSQYVQYPFSTEPTKEDTVVTAADQAEDMQTITHQQATTPAADTAKPPFPGTQDASRNSQESIADDGPVEDYSPKPAAQTQPPAATLDVSQPYASSKAKSTGQGAKPPIGYEASSPETQLGSSQTQGAATSPEQKNAVSDEKSSNASKSFASAEPREEDTNAATADQTGVPPTNVTRQVTSLIPDASDTLSSDQESSPDDGQISNLGSPLIARQGEASRAGRASEGSTPKVQSAIVDEKRTFSSSQAQTSSTGPDLTQIGGDAHLRVAGVPATSSMEKQEAEPSASTQAPTAETQLGSSQTQGEAAPADQKFAVSDEKSANASKSFASAEPREENMDAATADQTSVPPTNVTRQVTSSTPDDGDTLSRDQESSPDDGQIRNLGKSPVIASQEEASRTGRASEGSTPKVRSAIVDEKRTLPSSKAQTSSTGPDSTQIGGDARLRGAGMPATSSMEKQEAEPPAATQAPTSKGLQDSGNIESPRQASTDQTVTPVMNSAAPSDAAEGTEPGPDSSRSLQTPFSTEPTKEDTIVTAADQAEDMQTIIHQQAITPAPDTAKPPFPGTQDASRNSQESIPDDGPVENDSPKPAAQTQPPAATLDVSTPYASSKAKSIGQGAKPPTGYQASSLETQLGSSQTQGEAAPAEQKFAVSDEKSSNASKSFASAEPREEDKNADTADQRGVPPTNVTRQVTSLIPDASDTLSSDQESSPDDGQIRNLGSSLIGRQEEASRAGRASEGSTPKVHSAIVDEKRTFPSSQAQTSSTGPDSTEIGGDAHLRGAGVPATSSMEKQEAEPPASAQVPTTKGLQDSGNIESPRLASTARTVTPAMNSAALSDAAEGTEPGPDSSRSVQTPFSTESTKEDTIVTAKNTKDAPNSTEDAPGDGKAVSKFEHSSRSSEESKVQLQSEDKTQGHETGAASLETGNPSQGGLPANSYQNSSSQSQAEASKKSAEQSSGIWNKDNDSSKLDNSTDPTKPET